MKGPKPKRPEVFSTKSQTYIELGASAWEAVEARRLFGVDSDQYRAARERVEAARTRFAAACERIRT
jgi:hypothetical protein